MKNKFGQILVVFVSLFLVGQLLQTPQQRLTEQLKAEKFIPERLSQEKQLRLGQTGAAVVLGGLRSLIAAVMNLQAFGAFEEQDWVELEQLYDVIVTLQPNNTYYWATGAWHLAYNAYYDFEEKIGLSAARCRLKQSEYHQKGENMLLSAVEENPDEMSLWQDLGRLYNDPHKTYDFVKSAKYFKEAVRCSNSDDRMRREYFYTLGRVKGKEYEAWKLGEELMGNGNGRYPSVRSLYYVLSLIQNPNLLNDESFLTKVYFDNKHLAYKDTVNYWLRSGKEQLPRGPLATVIMNLASELGIPDTMNPIKNPRMLRITASAIENE